MKFAFSSRCVTRGVQLVAALAFALLITGCANQSTLSHNQAGRPSAQLAPGKGAVAVRVSVNSTGLNQYFTFWQIMKLRRAGASSAAPDFEITLNTNGAVGAATYIGQVPPGEYEIFYFVERTMWQRVHQLLRQG